MKTEDVRETASKEENRDVKSSSNRKPRNRKQRREDSKKSKANAGYRKTRGSNDLAWHTPDVELLRRAAEVSWSYQTGELIPINTPMYGSQPGTIEYAAQAGVLVIHDFISCGGAGYLTPTSKSSLYVNPTYNAANTLLTEMRSRARLRNTYDAPDIFMLTMAMANIYAGIIFAKRLAGTARMFTYQNTYLPEILLHAQGFDPEWFKINQYRFVTELNIIISEVNKIYIPNRMHLFELINERYANYYTEGDSIRDQLYVITPAMLNIFIPSGSGGSWASEVKPCMVFPGKVTNWGSVGTGTATQYDFSSRYTGDSLLNMLRRMIENVLAESATADITGDMANCFGESDRFSIPAADPYAIVAPVFDEEILETIHNSAVNPVVSDTYWNYISNGSGDAFNIIQDPNDNSIGVYDCFQQANTAAALNLQNAHSSFRVIDVHKDPSPEKTFAVTRMRPVTGLRSTDTSNIYTQMVFGADLPCDYQYWTFITNNNGDRVPLCRGFNTSFTASQLTDLMRLEPFHYRPLMFRFDPNSGYRYSNEWCTGESDIFAQIDAAMCLNMNRISLLTLLGAYNNL